MDRRTKQIGVTLCLMAMAFFAGWPFWSWISVKAVSPSLQEKTKMLVEKNPQLRPAWEIAMQDDVLSWPEAKVIVEGAGDTVEPE